jgi:hypothetical protein
MADIRKENLEIYGFKSAGSTHCNIQSFKGYLELIVQGRLVDSTLVKVTSDLEKEGLKNQQVQIQTNINHYESEINKNKNEIESKVCSINRLRQEIEDIKLGKNVEGSDKFSALKFCINIILLVILSLYLFLFYVAVIYKTFFAEIDLNNPAKVQEGLGPLPNWDLILEALSTNALIAVAPVIFFAFGYALHVIGEKKGKIKYLYSGLIIFITFILDFLLALKGYQKESELKQMMGIETEKWFQSTLFYIILFMGFVVYLIWSVLLNSMITEWQKRDILGKRIDLIKIYEVDITILKNEITKVEGNIKAAQAEINQLQKKIESEFVSNNDIKNCLAQFYVGWSKYGAQAGLELIIKECEIEYNTIYNRF